MTTVQPDSAPLARSREETPRSAGAAGLACRPVAFAFSGGGTLAAAQIGMLRALLEGGVVPEMVIGASAGAFNAVAFASRPSLAGIAQLAQLWTALRRREVLPVSAHRLYQAASGGRGGVLDNRGLRRLVGKSHCVARLEQTIVPAHVGVTGLQTGRPQVLSHGSSVDAVLASSSFPGVCSRRSN